MCVVTMKFKKNCGFPKERRKRFLCLFNVECKVGGESGMCIRSKKRLTMSECRRNELSWVKYKCMHWVGCGVRFFYVGSCDVLVWLLAEGNKFFIAFSFFHNFSLYTLCLVGGAEPAAWNSRWLRRDTDDEGKILWESSLLFFCLMKICWPITSKQWAGFYR